MQVGPCQHLEDFSEENLKSPESNECAECIKTGDRWVHLRTCQECGTTLCCDSSPNQHSRKHFMEQGHRFVISAEPAERWAYCFDHDTLIQY